MKAVVQRIASSGVSVGGELIDSVGRGYNILLGVEPDDSEKDAEILAAKIAKLRVFEDGMGKMNLSVLDIDGEALVISQFTLCADIKKGNRPSFTCAAPDKAEALYEYFIKQLAAQGVRKVGHGCFGEDMHVDIQNDGPVTILMDTKLWLPR